MAEQVWQAMRVLRHAQLRKLISTAKTKRHGLHHFRQEHPHLLANTTEIDSAWNAVDKVIDGNKWTGASKSGVPIEGYVNPRTTAYPIYRGKK